MVFSFIQYICCCNWVWLFSYWIFYKLYSCHHTSSSNITDSWIFILKSFKLTDKIFSYLLSILWKFFISKNFQYLHTKSTLKRSSTISVKKQIIKSWHNLFTSNNCCQRIAISHCFCGSNNIWFNPMIFESPKIFTDSPKTCLNLIRDD